MDPTFIYYLVNTIGSEYSWTSRDRMNSFTKVIKGYIPQISCIRNNKRDKLIKWIPWVEIAK